MNIAPPLLRMNSISKSFNSVPVLVDVDLEMQTGEILALLGENGAGKSTLIKILCGIHTPQSGTISVLGEPLSLGNSQAAAQAGISVIHQEFNLVPQLSVRENLFLGQETSLLGHLPVRHERERTLAIFERLQTRIDPEAKIASLTVAEQQLVEIAKALLADSKLIVMDEPTAALSPQEVQGLFEIIRELKSQGISVIYISHRLEEIFELCDPIMVLRDGRHVETRPTSDMSRDQLIERMVGRSLDQEFPRRTPNIGPVKLSAEKLCRGTTVKDVSFEVHHGEILAFAGLIGAGRTETMRLLFGADPKDSGTIRIDGKPISLQSPREAIAAGICMLTEDRKGQGLIVSHSVLDNFSLPNLARFSSNLGINGRQERAAFEHHRQSMSIKLQSPSQPAKTLSGGNQQKVVLAKWLERSADIFIFDEPTRGIDVGAKQEIYQLMNRLADAGKAIIMVSSELPEVLGMADRILVMHEGRITGEITDVANSSQSEIMNYAVR